MLSRSIAARRRALRIANRRVRGTYRSRLSLESLEDRRLLAVRVWDGGGADNLWSTAANWQDDLAPQGDDNLIFPAGAAQLTSVNDLAAGTRFRSLTFNGGGYAISGQGLTLVDGIATSNLSGINTLDLPLTLGAPQTFYAGNPGTGLHLQAIDTGNLLTLTFDGYGDIQIDGAVSGSGGLTKNGVGTTLLTQANTYEGLTLVNQGTLLASHSQALGAASGGTSVTAGAALVLQGDLTMDEPLSLRGNGVGVGFTEGGALRSLSGNSVLTGDVQLASSIATLIGVDSGVLTLQGSVDSTQISSGTLIKVGGGTLELAGNEANTYTGTTTVLGGTLRLNKAPGVNAVGGDLIIGDHLGGNDSAAVEVIANEQIPQTDYTGANLRTVTVNSGGRLVVADGVQETIGNLTLYQGVTYSADVATGTGKLTLGGNLQLNGFQGSSSESPAATISGNLDLGVFWSGGGTTTVRTFTINNTALQSDVVNLEISATISGPSDVAIYKQNSGTLRLSGNNTYQGATYLVSGLVEIGTDTAFGDGLVSFNGGALSAGSSARTVANPLQFDNTPYFVGAADLTFTGRAVLTSGRTIVVANPAQTVTLAGGIDEFIYSGRYDLAKSGPGTLMLTAPSTHGGVTRVNQDGGTLVLRDQGTVLNSVYTEVQAGGTFRIDNSGSANLAARLNDAMEFRLSGGKLQMWGAAGAASGETLGWLHLNSNTASVIELMPGAGGTHLLSARYLQRDGGSSVNFAGIGADLSADGDNQIRLHTMPNVGLQSGILPFARLTGSNGWEFASVVGSDDGFKVIPAPESLYVTSLAAAGPESLVRLSASETTTTKTVAGLLLEPGVTIDGASATSMLTVTSGIVLFSDNDTLNVPYLNFSTDGILAVAPGGTATINSAITGSVAINKTGDGTVILAGANQFSGQFNIDDGIVSVRHSSALGSVGGATYVSGGAGLELQAPDAAHPILIGLETLTLNGAGPDDRGALRSIAGDNRWAGNIVQGGTYREGYSLFESNNNVVPSMTYYGVDADSLTLSGVISNNVEFIKLGAGTLELAGGQANTFVAATRIKEGTLVLNKAPGAVALNSNPVLVGDDDGVGAPAVLRLQSSRQLYDDAVVRVSSTGTWDVNGQSEVIAGLELVVGPHGAGTVDLGAGKLSLLGNVTVQSIGDSNPAGAAILGGVLNVNTYGQNATTRYFYVNDAAAGDDLLVTASLQDAGIGFTTVQKNGFGTMVLGGTTANTHSGNTLAYEGTLVLNKPAGVAAMGGALYVGDDNFQSGGDDSDVVIWMNDDQLPDGTAVVTVRGTGRMDLNNHNETLGYGPLATGLQLQGGGDVTTGSGTLTLNGNLRYSGSYAVPATVSGKLDLGSGSDVPPRVFDIGLVASLPYSVIVNADITGGAGVFLLKQNSGGLLLSGNNTYQGDTFVQGGKLGIGSDTAVGAGRLSLNYMVAAEGGNHQIDNPLALDGSITFAGSNELLFTGDAVLTGGRTLTVSSPTYFTLAGDIGEMYGNQALAKSGPGFLALEGLLQHAGATTVNMGGGMLILRQQGELRNTASVTVALGGSLVLDNSLANHGDRVRDQAIINLNGGTLAYIGHAGAAAHEFLGNVNVGTGGVAGNNAAVISSQVFDAPGSEVGWTIDRLTPYSYSTINLIALGADLGSPQNRLFISPNNVPTLTNGIIPLAWLTTPATGEIDFVTYGADGFAAAPFVTDLATATSTDNVKLSGNATLTGNKQINALLIRGNDVTINESGGTRTFTIASGMLMSAPLLNSAASHTIATSRLTLSGNGYLITDRNTTTTVSAALNTGGLAIAGKGTLILEGNNTYAGSTNISEGIVIARSNTSFGTTAGNVYVGFGASAELQGGRTIGNEVLQINGTGVAIGNLSDNRGALRNTGGDSTWGTNTTGITYNFNNANGVYVDAGTRLVFNGTVSHSRDLYKLGEGVLEYRGTASNTVANNAVVYIQQGTLALNKASGTALPYNVVIGDEVGGNNADRLLLLNNNQITDTRVVTINSSGQFDLGGFDEEFVPTSTTNVFTFAVGLTGGGEIELSGGHLKLTGTSSVGANLQVNLSSFGNGMQGALITDTSGTGSVALAGTAASTLYVYDGPAEDDLTIAAAIVDGASSGALVKGLTASTSQNASRLRLSGANTYTGKTDIVGGDVVAASDTAFGGGAGNVTLSDQTALILDGGVTVGGKTLRVTGRGLVNNDAGALRSRNGDNVWSGPVTLTGTATIGVEPGAGLELAGVISGSGGVIKNFGGQLTYSGAAANTYTGGTTVNDGTLLLNKSVADGAIAAGTLTIGNNAGGANVDRVVLGASDQIKNTVAVVVNTSGLLDLAGFNEGLGASTALTLTIGPTFSATVDSGAGTLVLGGNVSVNYTGTFLYTSPAAEIKGQLDISNTPRTFDVDDRIGPVELLISATVSSGTNGGITRSGRGGTILLTADNSASYLGTTIVNDGTLAVADSTALGTGTLRTDKQGGVRAEGPNPVTITNPVLLNGNLVIHGSQDLTFSNTVELSGSNRTIYVNNVGQTIFSGADALDVALDLVTYTLTIDKRLNSRISVAGTIIDGVTAGNLLATGSGSLVLENANTYSGTTTITGGELTITNSQALGSSAAPTVVNSGGALVVSGSGNVLDEPLSLAGTGFNNQFLGALRLQDSAAGAVESVVMHGAVTLTANAAVGVRGSEAAPDELTLDGVISGAFSLTKVSHGTLILAGNAANTYSGGTFVSAGVLLLDAPGGNAVGTGGLVIGDDGDAAQGTVVRFGPAADGVSQINPAALVTVSSSGWFDLESTDHDETIGGLVLNRGRGSSAVVSTGNGVLTLADSSQATIATANFGATDDTTAPATIAGNLNILAQFPSFVVNDSFIPSANDDLVISAAISGGGAGGYLPGLREGRLPASWDEITANPGTALADTPRMGETNVGWGSNETWVYTGQIYDADGIFQFAESIDDYAEVIIDGVLRLRNTSATQVTTTATTSNNGYGGVTNFGMGPNGDGWHNLEIRFGNATGSGGATTGSTGWSTSKGFGYRNSGTASTTASDYVIPAGNISPVDGALRVFSDAALTVSGSGGLRLTGSNPTDWALNLSGGSTTLADSGAITAAPAVTVGTGARLVLDNTAGAADRLGDTAAVTLAGGTLVLQGGADGVTETVGAVTLAAGSASTMEVQNTGANLTSLAAASLDRQAGATVRFVGVGADLGSSTHDIRFAGGTPGFVGGILPYATVTGPAGLDLVANVGAGADFVVGKLASYDTDIDTPNANIKLDGSIDYVVLSTMNTINSLLITGNATVDLGGLMLSVTSGQIVSAAELAVIGSSITPENTALGVPAGTEVLFLVEGGGTLSVAPKLANSGGSVRKEGDGTLILGGDNTGVDGAFVVNKGTLTIMHSAGLGTADGTDLTGTTVNSGATLVLDGSAGDLAIGNETLTLHAAGTLQSLAGANSWAGAVTLASPAPSATHNVSVEAGSLQVASSIGRVSYYAGLLKTGSGTLEFAGNGNALTNSYDGTTTVAGGTLLLNKTGVSAGPGSIRGTLVVGDNEGAPGDDAVLYASGASSDQISGSIIVQRSGMVNQNGKSDSFGNLTLYDSTFTSANGTFLVNDTFLYGGTIDTGTGALRVNSRILYYSGGPAEIRGRLDLNSRLREIQVNPGPSDYDLVISADIFSDAGGFNKTGSGTLLLTGNNSQGGRNEQQTVTVSGATSFTITFNGQTTDPISNAPSATAADVQAALELLSNIGPGNVQVTGNAGGPFTVNFIGALAGTDVRQMSGAGVGGGSVSVSTPLGGGGTIVNTGVLALGSDTALGRTNVQIAGGALWAYGADRTINGSLALGRTDNATATFTLGGRREFDAAYNLSFTNAAQLSFLGNNTITVDDAQTTVRIGPTAETQVVTFSAQPSSGTWALTFNGETATNLAARITATALQDRLNALPGVAAAGGAVLVTYGVNNWTYVVTFAGDLSGQDLPLMTADTSGLTAAPALTIVEALAGGSVAQEVNGTGRTLIKLGLGRLSLAADNGFSGNTTVTSGVLNLQHSNALGTGSATVYVAGNAAVELESTAAAVDITDKNLILAIPSPPRYAAGGLGFFTGAVRNVSGNNSWTGNIDVRSNDTNARTVFLGADAGQLDIIGQITGSKSDGSALTTNALHKVGAGAIKFSGDTSNLYTGQTAVVDGTLILNKSAGATAVAGNLIVGDDVGNDGLQIAAPEQIVDTASVIFYSSADVQLLDGAGVETTGTMTLYVGKSRSAAIEIGAGSTLALGSNVTQNVVPGTLTASSATISGAGDLSLLAAGATANGSRTITTIDSPAAIDLLISARIVDGPSGFTANLIKAGYTASRMTLDSATANTYSGITTISSGFLAIRRADALGSTAGETRVNGGALELEGSLLISGETLTASGSGPIANNPTIWANSALGNGSVRSLGGNTVWAGDVVLTGSSVGVNVDGGSLTIDGKVTFSNNLIKLGSGILELAGGAGTSNTGTSQTHVYEGTLLLNKTGGTAISGNLYIGDTLGGSDADVVRIAAGASPDQLGSINVYVQAAGLLDLNDVDNTINNLYLAVAPDASATLLTGSGTLTLGGTTLATMVLPGTTAASPAARLAGNLNVGSTTQTLQINDSAAPSDLQLEAALSGSSLLTKTGVGAATLSAANGYTGQTWINEGLLIVASADALGTTDAGTLVNSGGALGFLGDIAYTAAESIVVASPGAGGVAALTNLGGNNTFAGAVTFNPAGPLPVTLGSAVAGDTLTLSGIVTVNASVSVTGPGVVSIPSDLVATGYAPGLREGILDGASQWTPANPGQGGVATSPRTANAIWGWFPNGTYVYTGQFYSADGTFGFGESFDDAVWVKVDGVVVQLSTSGTYATASSTAAGLADSATVSPTANSATPTADFGAGVDGWHDIEIRLSNSGGTAGPRFITATGWTSANGIGFGYTEDPLTTDDAARGNNYSNLIDLGANPTLLRTAVSYGLSVDGGNLVLGGNNAAFAGPVTVNGGTLSVGGTAANGSGTLQVVDGDVLVLSGGSTGDGGVTLDGGTLTVTDGGILGGGDLLINSGEVTVQSGGEAQFDQAYIDAGGVLIVDGTAGSGPIDVGGGTLAGSGDISDSTITVTDGIVEPGLTPTGLTVTGDTSFSGGTINFTATGSGVDALHTQYVVGAGGSINLDGATLNVIAATPEVGDRYYIVRNDSGNPAAVSGTFANYAHGDAVPAGDGTYFRIFYNDGPNNDVVLVRQGPLAVTDVVQHGETAPAQNSTITQITLTFNGIVDSLTGAVTLTALVRHANAQVPLTTYSQIVGEQTVYTIRFGNGNETTYLRGPLGNQVYALQDDYYQLDIDHSQVQSAGNALDSDVADVFFRYYGSTHTDYATVDAIDLTRFRQAMLGNPDYQQYFEQFDFDGDGDLDVNDYDHMRLNYARRINPPTP